MDTSQGKSEAGVDLGRVRAALAPVFVTLGLDLVDVAWVTEHSAWTLRITIERQSAGVSAAGFGVTLEDCSAVSHAASAALDLDEALIPHAYNLEVSSPGLDRPLRSAADFARFVGKLVKVKLSKPAADGQRVLRGPLAQANADAVAVIVDGKRIEALLADVVEARLVFELGPEPKKKPTAHRKKAKVEGIGTSASSKRQ